MDDAQLSSWLNGLGLYWIAGTLGFDTCNYPLNFLYMFSFSVDVFIPSYLDSLTLQ